MFILENTGVYPGKKSYFVNPSFESWDLTANIDEATKFETREESESMASAVNRGSALTFWDYDDVPPNAVVIEYSTRGSL